jgi:hypothetical protein
MLSSESLVVERGMAGREGGDARNPPKHAATRLLPAGSPEALAEFVCRRRMRRNAEFLMPQAQEAH